MWTIHYETSDECFNAQRNDELIVFTDSIIKQEQQDKKRIRAECVKNIQKIVVIAIHVSNKATIYYLYRWNHIIYTFRTATFYMISIDEWKTAYDKLSSKFYICVYKTIIYIYNKFWLKLFSIVYSWVIVRYPERTISKVFISILSYK